MPRTPLSRFQKNLNGGLIALVLLAILDRAPKDLYGAEIAALLAAAGRPARFHKGSIYPVLRMLASQQWLTSRIVPSYSGPPRRYYAITAQGREGLREWRSLWRDSRSFVRASSTSLRRRPRSVQRPGDGARLCARIALTAGLGGSLRGVTRAGRRRCVRRRLRIDAAPPGLQMRIVRRLDGLPEPWHQQRTRRAGGGVHRLGRLVPGMHREVERAPVHRQQQPPPSRRCAASAFSGPRWMSPHAGWNAPTSSITRSKGPRRVADSPYCGSGPYRR